MMNGIVGPLSSKLEGTAKGGLGFFFQYCLSCKSMSQSLPCSLSFSLGVRFLGGFSLFEFPPDSF